MLENLNSLAKVTDVEIVFDYTKYNPLYEGENFFGRLARMRQALIDSYLREDHEDVLWIDADIVEYPPDLYEQLRALSTGVASPLVLIEGTETNYDTASFREDVARRSSAGPPYFEQEGPIVQLVSTGCCLVMPAEVHRRQKFQAQHDSDDSWNTEWLSMCQKATEMGYEIVCDTRIVVQHANLPAYGEAFH